ncbi:uncharacterized protein LOC133182798 [Saccostrea echinata]|uniref:uncharacterized protein LOC133182798 n=1 Tax=Saccostrea echinata TaxID=191078 RepID=UPI002A7F00DA|nr:uncharacterized protein LOC133182798 [Saccostrea echinata]
MGNSVSAKRSSIEEEHRNLAKLLKAAKFGKWDEVWEVIGSPNYEKKSYMLNCIPEDRRWSVLQQAVWWNKTEVVNKLLQFSTIDTYGKAKEGKSEIGDDGGLTAFEIAEKFKYSGVSKVLHGFVCGIDGLEIDTFHDYSQVVERQEFGLFGLTLASYKKTFHPSTVDPTKPLSVVLKDVFEVMNTTDQWKTVRDKLSESVSVAYQEYYVEMRRCESRDVFLKKIINVYTNEDKRLYTRVNTALRRQKAPGYKPTAEDLALGPYILAFQLLLMFWNNLKTERKTTYRKMMLTKKDLEKYQKGIKFIWLSFVSSSVNPEKAIPFPTLRQNEESTYSAIFKIDNSCANTCLWQPKNIEKFAMFQEEERVYPAGSQFLVTDRIDKFDETQICLKLLSVPL